MYVIIFRVSVDTAKRDHYLAVESGTGQIMTFSSTATVARKFDLIRKEWATKDISFAQGVLDTDPVAMEIEGNDISVLAALTPYFKKKSTVAIQDKCLIGWRGIPVIHTILDNRKKIFMDVGREN
jgi:hypothetical protein